LRNRLLALISNSLPAWILILLGSGVGLISWFSDDLGLGAQPDVFGWKQILGVVLGAGMVAAGLMTAIRLQTRLRRMEAVPREPDLRRARLPDDKPTYDSAAIRFPFVHEIRELYNYRFLLWNLIARDLKVRYKRSFLGILWAMVNPLLTMVVLMIVFIKLFRFEVEHYPIYILSGILLWNLFAQGTSVAMHSVLGNSAILKKIYVPASVFTAAAIGSALINLLFALGPLLILALIDGVSPHLSWLFLFIPILQTAVFAFGVGAILAALVVFFADMLDIYQVLLNAYFYLTPIIYPVSILPEALIKLQGLNPLFYFIENFRAPLIEGRLPSLHQVLISWIIALVIMIIGWSLFTRLSEEFAYRT